MLSRAEEAIHYEYDLSMSVIYKCSSWLNLKNIDFFKCLKKKFKKILS